MVDLVTPTAAARTIPVVGIGASAGGLEALGELLEGLGTTTGMAFIVVQHLDPDRPSLLAQILSDKTAMPVAEVEDGTALVPDHVYIIPPNTALSLAGGVLRLQPRPEGRQPHLPVDFLLRSLAEERGSNAMGVVLSGSGSDGTRGIQAIKAAGGITFAQEEGSASFMGMPKNAIETGCVDFVLTPREIGSALARLSRHLNVRPSTVTPASGERAAQLNGPGPADDVAFKRVLRLLRASSGLDFTHYKHGTIRRRLARRMALHHLDSAATYADFLQDNAQEVVALSQDLLISVTSFFRDPEGLDALSQKVFPALLAARPPGEPIRAWVPGCASGEEAYSIAICLLEYLSAHAAAGAIQIFGTDVSDAAIERARAGIYPANIAQEVSPERLRRFFVELDDRYQIAKAIREMCVFAKHDATRDPPFARLDLVSCCNLLIYLDHAMQRQLLSLFHYSLKPHGFLILGPSESVGPSADLFEAIDKQGRIYRRKEVAGRRGLLVELQRAESPLREETSRIAALPAMVDSERMQREADRVLLSRYVPPCVLIDEDLNILQFRGETGPYLDPASGPASLSLRKLAAPAVLIALSSAMQAARASDAPVRTGAIRLDRGREVREIRLRVHPVRLPDAVPSGYLVTFEEMAAQPKGEAHPVWWRRLAAIRHARRPGHARSDLETERARLQGELAATREYLQSAIGEHEGAKEELKSAQEELLCSNEELQSTNEELLTSKEELQSANEELFTTNEELRDRNAELATLNEALQAARDYALAVIETTTAPLVVLDGTLHVVKANRAFYECFDTRAADTEGRFLYDLGNKQWQIPTLQTLLEQIVTEDRHFENYEVSHTFPEIGEKIMNVGGRRLPGSSERPEMILLSIEDITERKRLERELRQRVDDLATADRQKNDFLAMLAHELRNPLAPMRLAAETMRAIGSADSTIALGANVIDRQTKHLSRLVEDLLDVARINRGQIAVRKTPTHLAEIVDRAIEIGKPLIEEREHRLIVRPPAEEIYVEADSTRLAQLLANLLSNAAKFTPKGGTISVACHAMDRDVLIKVADSGIGIPAEALPHIFEMFYQADASLGGRYGGMGIGLALARRLVELHGGDIEARSDGPGTGAEFIVRLPRLQQPPACPAAEPGQAQHASPSRRVLIVDDSVDAAKATQMFLALRGHDARCAFDGSAAVRLAQEFSPHLVLLDIGMPGMDGFEVARELRRQVGPVRPLIVALSGHALRTGSAQLSKAGLDDYLVKPIGPETLLTLISSLT